MDSHTETYVVSLDRIDNYATTVKEFEQQHGAALTKASHRDQDTGKFYIVLSTENLSDLEVEQAVEKEMNAQR